MTFHAARSGLTCARWTFLSSIGGMLLGLACSDDGSPAAVDTTNDSTSTTGTGPEGTSVTLSTTTLTAGENEGESGETGSSSDAGVNDGSESSAALTGDDASSDSGSTSSGSSSSSASDTSGDTSSGEDTSSSTGEAPILEPILNEFVFNDVGNDDTEFVEVLGSPSTDYGTYALVEIEGDAGAQAGTVDYTAVVGFTNAAGYWDNGPLAGAFENGSVTVLLVREPAVALAVGQDVDTDNDGVIDNVLWAEIVDCIAVSDGGASDPAYCNVVLEPGFDGVNTTVPGASRIPDGTDTGQPSDWRRDTLDPALTPAQVPATEAVQTPGAENELGTQLPPPPPPPPPP